MKQNLILTSSLLLIFFSAKSQEYFEGVVHFKTTYETLQQNVSNELLIREFGDTLIGFVQESRYIMKSNNSGSSGEQTLLMLMDENIVYFIQEKSDTIYKYPIDIEKEELLDVHKIKDEEKVILGDSCPAIVLNTKNNDPESVFTISLGRYYYNPKYKLNKEAYKNHKIAHWDAFVDESGAISVRNEVRHEPIYKSVTEAFKIIPKKISDELFDVSRYNKVIIDLE